MESMRPPSIPGEPANTPKTNGVDFQLWLVWPGIGSRSWPRSFSTMRQPNANRRTTTRIGSRYHDTPCLSVALSSTARTRPAGVVLLVIGRWPNRPATRGKPASSSPPSRVSLSYAGPDQGQLRRLIPTPLAVLSVELMCARGPCVVCSPKAGTDVPW